MREEGGKEDEEERGNRNQERGIRCQE